MSQNPCPRCSADRPGLEDSCPQCGWRPSELRALGVHSESGNVEQVPSLRFSLRRLFGLVTVGCVALGTAIACAPRSNFIPAWTTSVLSVILAVEATLALYAACDPWLGIPSTIDSNRVAACGTPLRTGAITRALAILTGILFLLVGGFTSAMFVEDNWTMDSGGASSVEWLMGLPFVAATMIGSFARGVCLAGRCRCTERLSSSASHGLL